MSEKKGLVLIPRTLREANAFVEQNHRHHKPVVGHKFSIGVSDGEKVVGVAIVGRPVGRFLDDGWTLEVTRDVYKRQGRPSTYHLRSVEEMEGWQPPPDDLEGDFLAEFKEDPTSYFGYTEALGVELAETTAHLWAEFFPGKTPGPYDEKRTFFQIMVQSQNEDGEWSMSFPEENKELLGYAFEQGRKLSLIHI